MKIIVSRLPGDRPGPAIVDPLLVTEPVGVARGTGEIDYSASKSDERGTCLLMPYMPTGSMMHVTEAGGSYRGKLTAYSIVIDISDDGREFTATSPIAIERLMR